MLKRKRARGATQRTAQWVFASPGRVLALAAAVLLGFTLLLTNTALAQSVETLVSNTGKSNHTSESSNQAQVFTTGDNASGYGLTSVGIELDVVMSSPSVTVRIMPNSAGNEPDESDPTKVITLTNPATLTADSVNVFTAPADTVLEPDTTYHVVVTKPDSQSTSNLSFGITANTDEDSDKADGWSIANRKLRRSLNTQGWTQDFVSLLKIEIKGTVRPDTTAPSLSTAKVGGTRLELTYDEDLDDDSVPGTSAFSVTVDGSAVTVSSVSIGASTVTLTLGTAVTSGQTVTVTYTVPTGADPTPIQDIAGNDGAALTDQSVTYDADLACEALWCATLTVGVDPGDSSLRGFSQDDSAGSLSPRTFVHDGDTVTVTELYTYGLSDPFFVFACTGDLGDEPLVLRIGETSITTSDLNDCDEEFDSSPFGIFSIGDSLSVTLSAVEPEELSDDATLSSFEIRVEIAGDEDEGVVTFTPEFDPDVIVYTASVQRRWTDAYVNSLTTTEEAATTILIQPDGTQVSNFLFIELIDLVPNETTSFSIMVTAPDGETTRTYTFNISRGAVGATDAQLPGLPASVDALVSNVGQANFTDGHFDYRAQPFTTGSNAAGYEITRVGIALEQVSSSARLTVRLVPADSNNRPDNHVMNWITLGRPTAMAANSLNYFWAPAGTTLKANTTYFVVVTIANGPRFPLPSFSVTAEQDESIRATGWSIGDSRLAKIDSSLNWATIRTSLLQIAIIGKALDPAATGQPEITGITRVGETLTARIGTIADPNGLPASFPGDYTLQWVRVDGTNETDISGATSSTYKLVADDEGKRIKLRVSFTDDASNAEGPLTNTASPEVAGRLNNCTGARANADWCTTMTVGSRSSLRGFDRRNPDLVSTPFGDLGDHTINAGCSTYVVEAIVTRGLNLILETNLALPRGSRFFVDGTTYRINDAQIGTESNSRDRTRLSWRTSGLSWSDSNELTVALYLPATTNEYCRPSVVGISNLDESRDAAREVAALYHIAQAFTTGSEAGGYSFQGVGLVSTWDSGALGMRVVIREARADGRPGDVRYVMRNPGAMPERQVSLFRAPVGAFLEPDTTYMVALEPIYLENGTQLNGPQREPHVINYSFMFTESSNALARDGWNIGRWYQRGDSVTVEWHGFHPWSETDFGGWYQRVQSRRTLLMSVYAEPFVPDLDPWPTVNDEEETEGPDSRFVFAVNLSHVPTDEVRFYYATSNGTARAGSDYEARSGPLFIDAGNIEEGVGVTIINDSVEDDGETMRFTLTDVYGSFIVSATGTIRNEESIANPLTASFGSLPDSHSGEPFTFTLNFSEDVTGLSAAKLRGRAFTVSNGRVTAAQQVDPDSDEPSKTWRITVAPDADGPVTVSLPETTDCNASGGICVDEKPLSAPVSATIQGPAVWSATMTAALVYQDYGYIDLPGNQRGSLTSKSFEIEGETYAVKLSEAWDRIYIGFDKQIPVDFSLTVDDSELASADATHTSYSYAEVYTWSGQDIYWDDGDEVKLALYVQSADPEPSNSPATGAPTISGTAQVGQTLTADTSGIADGDGLNDVSFSYQWVRIDGSDDSDISGATSSTYTQTDDDEGKTIKVKVNFTDDAGNDEELTSAATGTVAARPNRAATGAPTISGTAQVGQTLTADTSGIADADGLTNVSWAYQWTANNGTSDSEIDGATGSTLFLLAAYEGNTIKVKVSFTDDAGHSEALTSLATDAVTLTAQAQQSNSEATGAPTISGTAQVGQTLTADTSGIGDEDGLDDASYSYQWVRNDGANDTDISGATSSSYTLTDDDQGKTIKVKVSFTDDSGNDEELTSAATDSVAARPNSAATGAPTISGTAQVGQTLTANTSGIADDDGLDDVSYTYQWVRSDGTDDTEITSATSSTYTLSADDEGKTVKVKVSFTDDAGNDEELTSAATGTVAARPNRAATGAPTISGTAQVGQTLTASTSGISDDDGLTNVSYTYQWIRNDGTDDSNISGANGSTYDLVDADQGKTIKVKVTFTDDAENDESLTSTATMEVAAPPLTADFLLVPASHDGETVFSFRISFTEDLQNKSGRRIIAALSVSGGTVKSANRVNKARDLFVVKVTPSGTGDIAISLPAFTGSCEDDDAICARDGRKLANLNQATVSGPGG